MKKQLIQHLAAKLHGYGYQVYIAESGEHGCYTDGRRVVSFGGHWRFSVDFTGNYRPVKPADGKYVGTGWSIEREVCDINRYSAKAYVEACAPRWATGDISVTYPTIEQHLKTYPASKYTLFTPKETP